MIDTQEIQHIYKQDLDKLVEITDLQWVIKKWPSLLQQNTRDLTPTLLNQINVNINKIKTGRARLYIEARDAIIHYLTSTANWTVPEEEAKRWVDIHNQKFERINQQRHFCQKMVEQHHEQLLNTLDIMEDGEDIPIAMLILNILLYTAPLSVERATYVVNNKTCFDNNLPMNMQLVLKSFKKQKQWARFELSPLCAYLIKYKLNAKYTISKAKLKSDILSYAASLTNQPSITYRKLSDAIQCHWYDQTNLWAADDILSPESQFSLTSERFDELINGKTLAQSLTVLRASNAFSSYQNQEKKQALSPKKTSNITVKFLTKMYDKGGRAEVINYVKKNPLCFDDENIVPYFQTSFALELIVCGGVDGKPLAKGSIDEYSSLNGYIRSNPLSYVDTFDENMFNAWAKQFYGSILDDSAKVHAYNFLYFIQTLSLGDALELGWLTKPSTPQITDANLVSPAEYKLLHKAIDNQNHQDPFQWLFTKAALTLAFHGALRVGEVLRLRIEDCEIENKAGDVYRLKITNTPEGDTKNKGSRFVYLSLPEEDAFYLKHVLTLKRGCDKEEPLLGFYYETKNQRNKRYIHPIINVIKLVCGKKVRFHHLRHGGVLILLLQGLSLFQKHISIPEILKHDTKLLTVAHANKRFNYWLEDRDIDALNELLLFDEVSKMLGHTSFNTTRKSYLHGHEWFPNLFFERDITISIRELRLLFNLPKGHGDLSRRIEALLSIDKKIPGINTVKQKAVTKPSQETTETITKDDIHIKDNEENNSVALNSYNKHHKHQIFTVSRQALLFTTQGHGHQFTSWLCGRGSSLGNNVDHTQKNRVRTNKANHQKQNHSNQVTGAENYNICPKNENITLPSMSFKQRCEQVIELHFNMPSNIASTWQSIAYKYHKLLTSPCREKTKHVATYWHGISKIHYILGNSFVNCRPLSKVQNKIYHRLKTYFNAENATFEIPCNKRTHAAVNTLLKSDLFQELQARTAEIGNKRHNKRLIITFNKSAKAINLIFDQLN